jgi:hypothetical protein
VDLKPAHARDRSGRSANLGGVVRERGQVVAVERHRVGELVAGNLHAVARISAEPDDGLIDHFAPSARYISQSRAHKVFNNPHISERMIARTSLPFPQAAPAGRPPCTPQSLAHRSEAWKWKPSRGSIQATSKHPK